jgi:hypothetical protein
LFFIFLTSPSLSQMFFSNLALGKPPQISSIALQPKALLRHHNSIWGCLFGWASGCQQAQACLCILGAVHSSIAWLSVANPHPLQPVPLGCWWCSSDVECLPGIWFLASQMNRMNLLCSIAILITRSFPVLL